MTKSHKEAWKEIWEAKSRRGGTELHRIDGNDLLTLAEWECTVRAVTAPLSLRAGMNLNHRRRLRSGDDCDGEHTAGRQLFCGRHLPLPDGAERII